MRISILYLNACPCILFAPFGLYILPTPYSSTTIMGVDFCHSSSGPRPTGPPRHCRRRPAHARRGRAPLSRPETLCFKFGQNISALKLGFIADKHFASSTVVAAADPSRRKQAHVPQTLPSFRWCAVTSTFTSQTLILYSIYSWWLAHSFILPHCRSSSWKVARM